MEINSKQNDIYFSSIKEDREIIFRGLIWNDSALIDTGLKSLRLKLGYNNERIGIVMMSVIYELTDDYFWDPHAKIKIIPEA